MWFNDIQAPAENARPLRYAAFFGETTRGSFLIPRNRDASTEALVVPAIFIPMFLIGKARKSCTLLRLTVKEVSIFENRNIFQTHIC